MTLSVTPTQEDTFTVLRAFLVSVLPDDVEVIQAQDNRVPEPVLPDFVTMTATRRDRLRTNVDSFTDAAFIGYIVGTVLTITTIKTGVIKIGDVVQGVGVTANTKILAFGTGTGGLGTYMVNKSQNVTATVIQLGAGRYQQNTQFTVQLDVHGPNSADNAQVISTMFRDEYAYTFFTNLNPEISPLYADNPHQMPFTNENQQVEDRWVIEAEIQVNATVIAPQQFADEVSVGLINVDATYPPN